MSLDVWFRDDIKHILIALNQASRTTATRLACQLADLHDLQNYPVSHDEAMRCAALQRATQDYRDGYADALRAVAIAFGIAIPVTAPDPLTHNVRLTPNRKEVIKHDGMSGL